MQKKTKLEFLVFIGLLAALLYFGSCKKPKIHPHYNKNWKTYTIDSGSHYSKPNYFKVYTRDQIDTGCAKVDSGLFYNLGDNDQFDWNKLRGYRFGSGNQNGVPNKAAIIGWRCVLDTLMKDTIPIANTHWEFAPYFNNHPTELIDLPDSSEILKVYDGEIVHWVREYVKSEAKITIWTANDTVSKSLYMGKYPIFYSVGFYFGGNEVAPNDIEIEIKE